MKLIYFVPIYSWGENPTSVHGNKSGTQMYSSLQDLFGFEPEAIGYYEVSGIMPTEREYKENIKGTI